jgi:DNA-binding phage protein
MSDLAPRRRSHVKASTKLSQPTGNPAFGTGLNVLQALGVNFEAKPAEVERAQGFYWT